MLDDRKIVCEHNNMIYLSFFELCNHEQEDLFNFLYNHKFKIDKKLSMFKTYNIDKYVYVYKINKYKSITLFKNYGIQYKIDYYDQSQKDDINIDYLNTSSIKELEDFFYKYNKQYLRKKKLKSLF